MNSIPQLAPETPAVEDQAVDVQLVDSLRLELRRGCLVVAVLAQLHEEHYGYTLRKALGERGLAIEESTLYPLLRRLETQGLLTSQWREEDKRNKRFYRLSPAGEATLTQLLAEWRGLNASLDNILNQSEVGLNQSDPEPE
jgi:PadR family transcriptional regulator PadR